MVWMSKNNKLSFIQIQDPSGLDVNFTKVSLPDSQEKMLKWHSIPEIKKQYERDMKREFGEEEKAPNEIDWQTLEMNAVQFYKKYEKILNKQMHRFQRQVN